MTEVGPRPLSWRDPDGFVVGIGGGIFRAVAISKAEQTRTLLQEPWFKQLIAEGVIPATSEVSKPSDIVEADGVGLWLEHKALFFPAYPHEITALQLLDSAQLTLRVAIEAINNGWTLKDASAWNVLHSNGRPVFVDLLSFDRLAPSRSWLPYGQFVRHFLLPLLLYRRLGLTPSEIFLSNRDGITPERTYELLRGLQLLSSVALELILLPKWLSRAGSRLISAQTQRPPSAVQRGIGTELVLSTLRRLQKMLNRLRPARAGRQSVWETYEETRGHYSAADLSTKTEFIRDNLGAAGAVLDIGCNAGEFSLLAGKSGHTVIATDFDHSALSRLYGRIREGSATNVTPLLLDIARPTPAVGWQNQEVDSFLNRAEGAFDCILILGLVHHLLVSERATVPMLRALLDKLRPKRIILEWVAPEDPKFRQLAGLNAALYSSLNAAVLESCLEKSLRMVAKCPLPCGTRVMYLWAR